MVVESEKKTPTKQRNVTQTMHYCKGDPSKLPYICCWFDPPKMSNLTTPVELPFLTQKTRFFPLNFRKGAVAKHDTPPWPWCDTSARRVKSSRVTSS